MHDPVPARSSKKRSGHGPVLDRAALCRYSVELGAIRRGGYFHGPRT